MATAERTFSEFLRQPNDVVSELAEGDVLLRRRNAPTLRLSRADHHEDRSKTIQALARLLRNLATHSPVVLDAAVGDAFPWTLFLPKPDREVFVEELCRMLLGAAEVDNYSPVTQLVREWKATAEIHADPRVARRLSKPLEASGDIVPAPAG